MNSKEVKIFPFSDDYVFSKVMEENKDICLEVARVCVGDLLGDVDIEDMEINHQQVVDPIKDAKSARLDIYMVNSAKEMIDIEMQTSNERNLPKRSRYYVGVNDVDNFNKGNKYNDLPKSIVVFICTFDPFRLGYKKYVAKEHLYVDDRCTKDVTEASGYDAEYGKIFLNTSNAKNPNVDEEIEALLNYIQTHKVTNVLTQKIDTKVHEVNVRERRHLMTLQEKFDEYGEKYFKEGIQKGLQEEKYKMMEKMISKGMSIDFIHDVTELSEEEIVAYMNKKNANIK